MKLSEIKQLNESHITDHDEILNLLKPFTDVGRIFQIEADGTVNSDTSVLINSYTEKSLIDENGKLKIKFGKVKNFHARSSLLKSFENFPHTAKYIVIENMSITSLVGISEHFKSVEEFDIKGNSDEIIEGGLEMLLIPDLEYIYGANEKPMVLAVNIINDYLQKPNHADLLFECQMDLIEAGLEKFAEM